MQLSPLIPVIKVDETKCVNCHACITACPVKLCNDGSGTTVVVNHDMCIGCGKCISACTHNARTYIDDFSKFISDIIARKKIIAISAPAIAVGFPDMYLQLNTWLKELGVEAIFDVSFGAELTTKSYIDYIKTEKPKTVIAQPCAAIVTYIQIYKPELIQYLAPVDSPMLHTIKMIKEFYPQYKNHKIAVLSPCMAKKREFEETGLGDYNIGHKSIFDFLEKEKINLKNYHGTNFDNPDAERAVMFSSPGGLMKTVERTIPDISDKTRKIEGNPLVYEYLDTLNNSIVTGKAPLLIDCLSCEQGCNSGPLTVSNEKTFDEIDFLIKKRSESLKNKYLEKSENNADLSKKNINTILERYSKKDLYNRKYINKKDNNSIKKPSAMQLISIFELMHKRTQEDIKNCSSCGYSSCEKMAVAIHNKLNRPENCHFYLQKESEISNEETRKSKQKLTTMFETATDGFIEVDGNGIITAANQAMCDILLQKEIVNKSLFNFATPESQKIIQEQLKLRKKGVKNSYEAELVRSTGKTVCCRISASPLLNGYNNTGSFAIVADISELKNTERLLKKVNESLEEKVQERTKALSVANEELVTKSVEMSELIEELNTNNEVIESINKELEQLSIVASETTNGVVIMNADGVIEWVNDAFVNIYGFNFAKLIIDKKKNIKEASNNPEINDIFEKVVDERVSEKFSNYEKNKHGDTIYTQTTLSPVIKNGEIVKLVAINSDITELQRAKEEISQRNEEIQQQKEELLVQRDAMANSEAQIKKILESLPDAGFVIDSKGRVIYWNKSIEKMTGVLSEEIIGKGNYEYSIPFYNDRRPVLIDLTTIDSDILKKEYSFVEKTGNVLKAETFVPSLKGEKRFLIGTATAFYDSKGEYSGAIEIIHDITERKNIQDKIEIQKIEIERKNSEITNSILYARRIQKAILPKTNVLTSNLDEYFILYKPKDIISGDFFWSKQINNYTVVATADCTGHGVPGAFMSMLGISFLNEIITKNNTDSPAKILEKLRKRVKKALNQTGKTFEQKDGMDITLLFINFETLKLEFAAANNSATLVRHNQIIDLPADKMPIGVHHKEYPFTNNIIDLQKGDIIYTYSDGYQDQFGGQHGRKLLIKNFKQIMLEIHKKPLSEQNQFLSDYLDNWMLHKDYSGNTYLQVDDILVMGIKI